MTSLLRSRPAIIALGIWLSIIVFDVLWCAITTFRAMSFPELYVNAALLACLLALPTVFYRRLWLPAVLMLLLDGVLIANLMYCRTYYAPIPLGSYALAGNLRDFGPAVIESLRWYDMLIPLASLLTLLWCYRRPMPTNGAQRTIFVGMTGALGLISGVIMLCRGGFFTHYDRLEASCYYTTCRLPVYTPAGQLLRETVIRNETATPEEIELVNRFRQGLRPVPSLADSASVPSSVVLVLCESLESWVVGATVDGRAVTPVLDSLISDPGTLYIPHTLTQVDAGRSIDCQLLVNTGLLPPQGSVWAMNHIDREYPSFQKELKRHYGTRSYILTCDKPTVWNQARVADALGFDSLLTAGQWELDETIGNPPKLSDGSFLRQVTARMASGDIWPINERAFVQIVTYSGHSPFRLPASIPHFPTPDKWPQRMRDYVATAHYTDSALGTLIRYLKSRPDFVNTLLVITGDHEGLGTDRQAWISDSAVPSGLVDEGCFTPLIIANIPAIPENIPALIGQNDIYSTLLTLTGCADSSWPGTGCSIFDPTHPSAALHVATGTVVTSDGQEADKEQRLRLEESRKASHLIISRGL